METPIDITNFAKRRSLKAPAYKAQFAALKTNLDRVNFVYQDLENFAEFLVFKKDEKDDSVSVKTRQNGNDFFKAEQYKQALDCYTSSITTANTKGILALAYANRSATLSKLNLHKECLIDIDRALESGYPDNLKPKLIARRKLSKAQKTPQLTYYEPTPTFPECKKNDSIPNARNCLKIATNKRFGNHLVATRDVEIGEILAVEKPLAGVLNDEFLIHCHECLELCYNLIPCNNCTQALYCSESCKEQAYNTYHKYECEILLTLKPIFNDTTHVVLKMLLMARNELSKDFKQSDWCRDISKLMTHTEQRTVDNLFFESVRSAKFFHLIKNHTNFFQNEIGDDDAKELLLLLILVCDVNLASIRKVVPQIMGFSDIKPFAVALYPF